MLNDTISIHVGVVQVIVASLLGLLLVRVYAWILSQSRPVAWLVAMGILGRTLIGLALFWASYLNLAMVRGMHSGDGFWLLARDARGYFRIASQATIDGLWTIPSGETNFQFIRILTVWMGLVGASPVSGLFLNVTMYVVLCALVITVFRPTHVWRSALPCIICLAPFSVTPTLLVHASQPLKEEMSVFLIATTCVATFALLRPSIAARPWRDLAALVLPAIVLLGTATYVMSGVRGYIVVFILMCLGVGVVAFVCHARGPGLVRAVVVGAATLAVAWLGYFLAGQTYGDVAATAAKELGTMTISTVQRLTVQGSSTLNGLVAELEAPRVPAAPAPAATSLVPPSLRERRVGFEHSGGATNIVPWSVDDEAVELGKANHSLSAVMGLAVLYVPISLLQVAGLAKFDGGQGLLLVTDVDTLLIDASVLAVAVLLLLHRKNVRRNIPYILFVFGLGCFTSLLLSYIVTNFGTLFRLRPLAVTPLWMAALAVHEGIKLPGQLTGWEHRHLTTTMHRFGGTPTA